MALDLPNAEEHGMRVRNYGHKLIRVPKRLRKNGARLMSLKGGITRHAATDQHVRSSGNVWR